jgi:hypothetical protein
MPNLTTENLAIEAAQARRLEAGRLQAQWTAELEASAPTAGETPSPEDEEDETESGDERVDLPDDQGKEEESALSIKDIQTQIRWRLIFWGVALGGAWLFIPLLPVLFHKLAMDAKLKSGLAGPGSRNFAQIGFEDQIEHPIAESGIEFQTGMMHDLRTYPLQNFHEDKQH